MVNLDVVAHLQQLVQARGWLTGIHVYRIIRLTWRINLFFGFKFKVVLLIKQQDQTRQSEIPLWIPVNKYGTNLTKQTKRLSITLRETYPQFKIMRTMKDINKPHYPNPFLFTSLSCSTMTNWTHGSTKYAILSFTKSVRQQLRKCTQRAQHIINHGTSMWKQFPGIIGITEIKLITNIYCRIVLGLVKSL